MFGVSAPKSSAFTKQFSAIDEIPLAPVKERASQTDLENNTNQGRAAGREYRLLLHSSLEGAAGRLGVQIFNFGIVVQLPMPSWNGSPIPGLLQPDGQQIHPR